MLRRYVTSASGYPLTPTIEQAMSKMKPSQPTHDTESTQPCKSFKQPIDSPESRTGCLFPIRKRIEFNTYYEHQNNTGKRPYQQLNQFRLVLNLHF
jgi:hypothetical protein